MNVYENINNYLHTNGITKAHVATRSGIKKPRFSNITTGVSGMTLNEYLAICKALGVKVTQFIDD